MLRQAEHPQLRQLRPGDRQPTVGTSAGQSGDLMPACQNLAIQCVDVALGGGYELGLLAELAAGLKPVAEPLTDQLERVATDL